MKQTLRKITKFFARPFTAYWDRRFTQIQLGLAQDIEELKRQIYTDAETVSEMLAVHGRMLSRIEEHLDALAESRRVRDSETPNVKAESYVDGN